MTSWWARWRPKSQASRLFTQSFIQTQIKETSRLRVTGLCEGNSPETGELPAQMASYAENVSIWWRHHDNINYEKHDNALPDVFFFLIRGMLIRYFFNELEM